MPPRQLSRWPAAWSTRFTRNKKPCWGKSYSSDPLSPDFAQWLAAFDLVISFWPDPDRELAARFPLHSDQRFIGSVPHPPSGPAAAHFLSTLAVLALPSVPVWVRLFRCRHHPATARKGRVYVVLHPGSGSPRKNWPLARWKELAAWLGAETTLPLEIISGPAEDTEPLSGLGTALRHRPLEELVGHLRERQLFIGTIGISHPRGVRRTWCVLLFGPTSPETRRPTLAATTVVAHGSELQSLSLAAVQRAVRAALFADSAADRAMVPFSSTVVRSKLFRPRPPTAFPAASTPQSAPFAPSAGRRFSSRPPRGRDWSPPMIAS
jgi:hypothetical protein